MPGRCTPVWSAALLALVLPTVSGAGEVCLLSEGPIPAATARLHAPSWMQAAVVELRRERTCFFDVPAGRLQLSLDAPEGSPTMEFDLLPAERLQARVLGGAAGWQLQLERRGTSPLQTPFDARALRELPSSDEPWSLLETVEPVAISDRMDGGGLWTATPGRASTHGSSWTQTSFRLGAVDVTDPLHTGLPLWLPGFEAVQAFDVATGALGAELGPPGAHVLLQPTLPPDRWRATLEGDSTLGEGRRAGTAVSTRNDGPEPPIARFGHRRRATASVGGPLGGAARALVSGAFEEGARVERGEPARLESELFSLRGALVWAPGRDHELRAQAGWQHARRPFEGRFRLAERDLRERDRLTFAQAGWRARRPSGLLAAFDLAHFTAALHPEAGQATGTFERLVQGPLPEMPLTGDSRRRRSTAVAVLHLPATRTLGVWHAVQVGVEAARAGADTGPLSAAVESAELLGGRPARVWRYAAAGLDSRWRATELALYASDVLMLGERLRLEAGLRFETTGATAEGAGTSIRWSALSPRLLARWQPVKALSLMGFYGRYRHRLPLGLLAWGDPAAPRGEVFSWRDDNGDRLFQPPERGPLVARVGPGAPLGALDPELRAPHTEEFVVGAEARAGLIRVALVGIHRNERDLVESVNVGVPAERYLVRVVPDPAGDIVGPQDDQLLPLYERPPATFGADRFLLTNPGHHTTHQGAELTVELRSERVQVLLGATAHRSDGAGGHRGFRPTENDQGLTGDLFDDPNSQTHARGRLFSDRAYTIKLSGSWRAPADLRLGMAARYQDGQPFARLVLAPLPQGLVPVQAIQNGRARFTYTLTLDARLEKGFALGGGRRAAAVLEGFNLLQTAHEVEEDPVSGPGYRAVTFRQPPRALRLGLRLEL